MKNKKEVIELLKDERRYLEEKFFVQSVGLFGSYARDEQSELSDIDLLVEFRKPIDFFELFDLEAYLAEKLGAKVEIVTPEALKERIKPRILKEVVYV